MILVGIEDTPDSAKRIKEILSELGYKEPWRVVREQSDQPLGIKVDVANLGISIVIPKNLKGKKILISYSD